MAGNGTVALGTATLTFGDSTPTQTFSGTVSGSGGSIIKQGAGTVTLSGANSYTGATTVNGGTLILSQVNNYTGATTVNAGTLQGGAANVFGGSSSTSALVMGGGTLNMGGHSQSFGSLTGSGTITTITEPGAVPLTIGYSNTSPAAYSGTIQGWIDLTKVGTGTLILSGANSYTGATTVHGGMLEAGIATNAFGSSSAVTLDNTVGVVLALNSHSNTIGSLNGGGTTGGNVTLGSGTLTTGALNTTDTFAGVISGGGGLTKNGNGTMTLSGANTYSGATTVNAGGTLYGGAANVFGGSSSNSALVMGGGTLDMDGNSQAFGSLAGTGTITSKRIWKYDPLPSGMITQIQQLLVELSRTDLALPYLLRKLVLERSFFPERIPIQEQPLFMAECLRLESPQTLSAPTQPYRWTI